MPFLSTPHTTMYYDVFEPDFTTTGRIPHPSTVLLIHGFGGTPESDFEGQLPALSRYCVVAPHLHGYGRSTKREAYTLTFYRDDAADLAMLLDWLRIEHTLVLGFSDGGIVGAAHGECAECSGDTPLAARRATARGLAGATGSITWRTVLAQAANDVCGRPGGAGGRGRGDHYRRGTCKYSLPSTDYAWETRSRGTGRLRACNCRTYLRLGAVIV
ncbi:MAG: alpha/beta hydrolase [Chloroflexi bacterium]|nr:MAG: alpha/beta hydrolase [Chloroflexota bacterium]